MRRWLMSTMLAGVALCSAPSLRAQGLRGDITQLFIFGPGEDPLFLAGSGDPNNPMSLQVHGRHFIPSASASNGSIISFLTDAVGSSVANIPLGATSSGETFRFVGGVPQRTSTSAGPIFGERAQTLGRGRALVGVNHTGFHLESLRGVSLDNLQLRFTHENVNFPGCDTLFGGNCSSMGVPGFENDVIDINLRLNIDVNVTSLYVTYGLFDRMDIGFVVPIVSTSLRGESNAQIVPFGPPPVAHFFGGTPENPVLTANRNVESSATGLGDLAVRAKLNLRSTEHTSLALLGDARFPTGSSRDLLGAGFFSARGLAVLSSQFGSFAPHINAGYLFRKGNSQNDAVLATVGFDQLIGDRVTLAADLVSELQVGDSKLQLPAPVHYDAPYARTVLPTDIPDMRDDLVDGSFGIKYQTLEKVTVVANATFPLNKGGLRPGVTYTVGLEYTF